MPRRTAHHIVVQDSLKLPSCCTALHRRIPKPSSMHASDHLCGAIEQRSNLRLLEQVWIPLADSLQCVAPVKTLPVGTTIWHGGGKLRPCRHRATAARDAMENYMFLRVILLLSIAPIVATGLRAERDEALQTLAQKYFPCPTFTHCSLDLIRLLPLHVLYAVISLPVNW
jgi:hypothetical protein